MWLITNSRGDPDIPRDLCRNEVASKFPFEYLPNLDTGRH